MVKKRVVTTRTRSKMLKVILNIDFGFKKLIKNGFSLTIKPLINEVYQIKSCVLHLKL
jgi:hypothetical protein